MLAVPDRAAEPEEPSPSFISEADLPIIFAILQDIRQLSHSTPIATRHQFSQRDTRGRTGEEQPSKIYPSFAPPACASGASDVGGPRTRHVIRAPAVIHAVVPVARMRENHPTYPCLYPPVSAKEVVDVGGPRTGGQFLVAGGLAGVGRTGTGRRSARS
ncbi:hypothetical protein OPV22_001520 [Ensete ventricosum]|uniref:Uncharacterized protein n=1 Tax=Ensete ventricosum TaxID=4639 RepID=A0AAV8QCI6_ENSVE|nr:hypothetical protein OPV22_001520 [Ensete ventricosum]